MTEMKVIEVRKVKEKCPHCGYMTFINNTVCMSCGYGMQEPILKKDTADKNKDKKVTDARPALTKGV